MKTTKHNKNQNNTFNILIRNTMKTRTIIATIAVAIIAGVSIFAACTKEEKKEKVINGSTSKLSYVSALETAGQEHNRLLYNIGLMIRNELDSCAALINAGTYSDDDEAWMLQVIQDSITKMCTQSSICPVSEDSLEYVFANINNYSSEDFFNEEFANSASDYVLSGILMSNSNSTDIYPIITDVSTAIDNVDITQMSHGDSILLAQLMVFRYSLLFWNDAVDNVENPWHNLIMSIITNYYVGSDKENFFRKAWQWVKDKIINPVVTVVLSTVTCDALGAIVWLPTIPGSVGIKAVVNAGCSCIGLIAGIKFVLNNN